MEVDRVEAEVADRGGVESSLIAEIVDGEHERASKNAGSAAKRS